MPPTLPYQYNLPSNLPSELPDDLQKQLDDIRKQSTRQRFPVEPPVRVEDSRRAPPPTPREPPP